MTSIDCSIAGVAKTVAEIQGKKKCAIDYGQREYKFAIKPYSESKKAGVIERGNLYCNIAEQGWRLDNLHAVVGGAR